MERTTGRECGSHVLLRWAFKTHPWIKPHLSAQFLGPQHKLKLSLEVPNREVPFHVGFRRLSIGWIETKAEGVLVLRPLPTEM